MISQCPLVFSALVSMIFDVLLVDARTQLQKRFAPLGRQSLQEPLLGQRWSHTLGLAESATDEDHANLQAESIAQHLVGPTSSGSFDEMRTRSTSRKPSQTEPNPGDRMIRLSELLVEASGRRNNPHSGRKLPQRLSRKFYKLDDNGKVIEKPDISGNTDQISKLSSAQRLCRIACMKPHKRSFLRWIMGDFGINTNKFPEEILLIYLLASRAPPSTDDEDLKLINVTLHKLSQVAQCDVPFYRNAAGVAFNKLITELKSEHKPLFEFSNINDYDLIQYNDRIVKY